MSRIDDLRLQYAGKKPSSIPTEILQELLLIPYEDSDKELRARSAIIEGKTRGTLNYAIRAKCLDCVGWVSSEVTACVSVGCPLWPFRMGENPLRKKRVPSEKQLAALQIPSN